MAGSLSAGLETHVRMICDPLRCLIRAGFIRVFVLNGHGGNIDGWHMALRQLATEFPGALLHGANYWDFAGEEIAHLLDGDPKSVGHACEFETSLMLYVRPELVRKDQIFDFPLRGSETDVYVPLDMKRQTPCGGNGQPSLATAEKGRLLVDAAVARGVQVIKNIRAKKASG
jgi:creatinine amidohydrolase